MMKTFFLFLFLLAFSQAQTQYMRIITNSELITHTTDSALYQISLPELAPYCNSSDDIAIYRQGVPVKRRCIYSLSKLLLYWYAPKTAGQSDTFTLHLGPSVNKLGQLLLTRSDTYISFDTIVYGETTNQSRSLTGSYNANHQSFPRISVRPSFFGDGISNDSARYAQLTPNPNFLAGTTTLYTSVIVSWSTYAIGNAYFFIGANAGNRFVCTQNTNQFVWWFDTDNTQLGNVTLNRGTDYPVNTPLLMETVFDGSLATNEERFKVYINGQQKTLNITGTIPLMFHAASMPSFIGSNLAIPYREIDEFNFSTRIETFDPDRYNMLFAHTFFNKSGLQKAFTIDSCKIRQGFYLTFSQKNVVFDSVHIDGASTVIVGQSSTHLEFTPTSAIRGTHSVAFYYGEESETFTLSVVTTHPAKVIFYKPFKWGF